MNHRELNSLFLVGVRDLSDLKETRAFLKHYPVGGLIFFNAPIDSDTYLWGSHEEACEKLYAFNRLAFENNVFLAVDQEGGRVQRLKEPLTKIPAQRKQGKALENGLPASHFFDFYSCIASQLKYSGFSLNFAPVLDLLDSGSNELVVGDRSFSDRMDTVIQLGRLYCEAFENAGVGSTIKHFPGHGSSAEDSHEQVGRLQKSYEELQQTDLRIFEQVAPSATAIMPGHLCLPDSDSVLSLDKDWILKEREKLPTHLLWISDDLVLMKAVSELSPWKTCIELKYDFISLCGNFDQAAQAIDESIKYVESEYSNFSEQQSLELRCRHAREIFLEGNREIPNFKTWKKQLVELGEKGNLMLEAINEYSEA